jgi:cell wall-associated NlpC family hydrolase
LRKYYVYRTILIVLPILACIPFLLPSRAIDATELRANYLQALARYEGSTYYWGGENMRGIDCSGLPRRSLRDALLRYGIAHGNGKAFRLAAEQWYYDTSAKALGEGYRSFTKNLAIEGTVQSIDNSTLKAGDLAVTKSGIHTMVYLGEGKWIQADPGIGAVATLHSRNDQNTWFDAPITMHRWSILDLP